MNKKAFWGGIYTERPNPINQLPASQLVTSAWETSETTAIADTALRQIVLALAKLLTILAG